MLHRILTADKGAWFAGGKTAIINQDAQPLSSGDVYINKWANPLLKRGVPKDQKQLLESARQQKALFITPLEKPFYPRSGGNKSTGHPNDVFDVIGDAEQSGGVTRRHLGYSTRFGVADSADNRVPGGGLPSPPARASTLRSTRPRTKGSSATVQIKKLNPMSASAPLAAFKRGGNNAAGGIDNDELENGGEGDYDHGNSSPQHRRRGSPTSPTYIDPYASSDDDVQDQ